MPTVSVIMPVWGAAEFIEQSMTSVLDQDFSDLELILVNDCSPDDSIAIAQAVARDRNDDRVVIVNRSSNGGVSAARNTGLDHARGSFVAFIDNDDHYLPGYLSLLVNEMRSGPGIDVVVACPERVLEDGRIVPPPSALTKAGPMTVSGLEAARLSLQDRISCFPWDKLYSRSILSSLRFPEGMLFEDMVVTTLACLEAERVRVLPDVIYQYATRAGSQTWKDLPPLSDLDRAETILDRAVEPHLAGDRALALAFDRRRTLMTLLLAHRAMLRPVDDPAAQAMLTACAAKVPAARALRLARHYPFISAAALGFIIAPRTYQRIYRAYARRTFGIGE